MIIHNEAEAHAVLARVGFYRFKGFALHFQQLHMAGKPYTPGTKFDDVLTLMQLDTRLRLHIFAGIQEVEIGIRQCMAEQLMQTHGLRWYTDSALFRTPRPGRSDFDHSLFLVQARAEFDRSHEPFVTHYRQSYSGAYPPSWMLAEVVSFGTWSKLYAALHTPEQKRIADVLGIHQNTLREWLKALSIVRNVTAHHSRIWNREFRTMHIADRRPPELLTALQSHSFVPDDPQARRLAPRLYALHRLTQAFDPHSRWTTQLVALLAPYPAPLLARVGFRPGWDGQSEWA
ncbi:hypothetical protein GCM10017783_11990 [Deinococcus piscis]|uniref:Abi family protein n=1 Tax=Deinococcus piscis TaxID=394230 RepID=A0ABQ3K2Q6_9DEIO|nr:Abi family protein [Deinococcus piscis]GHG01343.1 hypothetical protein GCM10017783_11990 [Deinococcus piscis]